MAVVISAMVWARNESPELNYKSDAANNLGLAHMTESVSHELLITLLHGTWGRGFFPRLRTQDQRPLWFETKSPFRRRLSAELTDIPHEINQLLWSGSNSIFERDKAAHALATHLIAEQIKKPQATQIVVAHSHGGNIALRALEYLKNHGASHPLIVTLATPFIEIHPTRFDDKASFIRLALVSSLFVLLMFGILFLNVFLELPGRIFLVLAVFWLAAFIFATWWWDGRRETARQDRLSTLKEAARIGSLGSAQRLLVLRAIDDEASLTLALGTMLNYVIPNIVKIGGTMLVLYVLAWGLLHVLGYMQYMPSWLRDSFIGLLIGSCTITISLVGALMLSRSVHGRELALASMECQINTQSTPDGNNLCQVVTLIPDRIMLGKSLRHGIYQYDDCARVIAKWVRSQLAANTG
jgi:hypothetical protein